MMKSKEQGFTLLEMMVTMGIGLVIMAGMTSVFVSQTRTASMLKSKTEAMGDLFLASQIIQGELRSAKDICWTGSSLFYQPADSSDPILPCGTVSLKNGSFDYQTNTATDWRVMWKRPNKRRAEELLRNMPIAGGMTVNVLVGTVSVPTSYEVTMQSLFQGQGNQSKSLGLTFKVWARN